MSLEKYSCPKCTAKCRNIKKGAHELALGPAMSPSFSDHTILYFYDLWVNAEYEFGK